jgi:hypothetical protein
MPTETLFENEHLTVTALDEPIVLMVRQPTRVQADGLDAIWGAADRALARVDRGQYCLVVDVTAAAGRNEEDFEKAFAPYRQRLSTGWLEMALVVASVPGKLQVQRYARQDRARVSTFDDREAALAWVRKALLRR